MRNKEPITILACPQMVDLAQRMNQPLPEELSLFEACDTDIIWGKFESGFGKIRLRPQAIQDRHVYFLACFDDPADIFDQLSVIYAIPGHGALSLTVILPFFPTGTMDRAEEDGDVVTADSLAKMFEPVPLTQNGPMRLVIYDIHALQEKSFFHGIVPILKTTMEMIRPLLNIGRGYDTVVAFPDEGAQKRFKNYFADCEQILCHKVRRGDKKIVTIKEGSPRGRRIIIIDDLVRTGGTLLGCARALKRAGAERVDIFVPHAAFAPGGWQVFAPAVSKGLIKTFYTTESCPLAIQQIVSQPGFAVWTLHNLFRELIK